MGLKIKLLALLLSVLFFLFVLAFVRKRSLQPSFALLWVLVALFLLSIPLFESLHTWLAYSVIGMTDARNIVYVILIGFLIIYVFYLTTRVSMLDDRVQELISFTAILEKRASDNESAAPDQIVAGRPPPTAQQADPGDGGTAG